jgi:hypothetical protein
MLLNALPSVHTHSLTAAGKTCKAEAQPTTQSEHTSPSTCTARLVTRWLEGISTPMTCAVSAASRNRPPAVSTAAT